MSVETRAEVQPDGSEALEGDGSDDFDSDLGDASKTGHVAPILPPA